MKFLIYLTIFMTKVQLAFAYIPPLEFILNKSTATTGRQIIGIEQDVIFKVGTEEAVVHETWLIEGDKNLKLTAKGVGAFKPNIDLEYLYNSNRKTIIAAKNKVVTPLTTDFFEKLLFIRSTESFKNYLKNLGVSNQVRLSRADGRIAFAIGDASTITPVVKLNPQIWIDQDEFVIRKIRLPSEVEIDLSNIVQIPNSGASSLASNLYIAKSQTISWAGLRIQINVKNISTKTGANLSRFHPQNLERPSEITFANKSTLTEAIDQFYKRFR